MTIIRVFLLVANTQRLNKRRLRHFDLAKLTHTQFAFFLFIQQFAFTRYITTVAFGRHIFAQCRNGFAGNKRPPIAA